MADMVQRFQASQLGLITLEQTLEAGMSERTRKRRCASGEWVRAPSARLPIDRISAIS